MFLNPAESPDAFLDFPPVDQTNWPKGATLCPNCQGHGGWNLKINAYPLHDKEDTAENRHYFRHFRASCGACWGYGFLQPGQTCAHEWTSSRSIGHCLSIWTCGKCGAEREVDSSD